MSSYIIRETDKRFYIAKSTLPGAGEGLFAKVQLAKGALLEVIGALVPAKSISDRCTLYSDAYKFRVGKYLLVPTGYGGIANHSPLPNMKKVIKGKRVYLRALRSIAKGEELLYVYSRYAEERFRLSPVERLTLRSKI
jgi:hypothetical protein